MFHNPIAPAMPCSSCQHNFEHRRKEQALKHVSALSGIDAMAVAVEADETVDQMIERLMDINARGMPDTAHRAR